MYTVQFRFYKTIIKVLRLINPTPLLKIYRQKIYADSVNTFLDADWLSRDYTKGGKTAYWADEEETPTKKVKISFIKSIIGTDFYKNRM